MWLVRIALLIGLVGVFALADDADYEYDEAPEPVPARKPITIGNRGARPPLTLPGKINKIPASPVKSPLRKGAAPPPPPAEPEELPPEEEEEIDEGEGEQPVEETQTEPPKKTIKPVVRPFRSNDDLLAALKRRRQQAQEKGTVVDKTTQSPLFSTEAPKKVVPTINKRPRTNPKSSELPSEAARKSSTGRKQPNRGSRPVEEEQPEVEATVPPRSKFNRGSRRP